MGRPVKPKVKRIPRNIQKAEDKRNRILNAASECFLGRGYHPTTLGEIAALARIESGHLTYYYKTKAELFKAVLERSDSIARAKQLAVSEINDLELMEYRLALDIRQAKDL